MATLETLAKEALKHMGISGNMQTLKSEVMIMRLIDADKLLRFFTVDTANQTYRFGTIKKQIENAKTVQAIPIPDNATNGDMIKAMFPYGKYGTNGNEVHVYGVGGNGCLVFTLDWWNASYKRGSENGSN